MSYLTEIGEKAKTAAARLSFTGTAEKNKALEYIANALQRCKDEILDANLIDVDNGIDSGLSESLLDRLSLNESRIDAIANSLRKVIALPDPVGRTLGGSVHTNGMRILKKSVPIGVIGIIYEARPNVTVDAAGLCVKSGNAVILRGGKEAINSNMTLVKVMRSALLDAGLNPDSIQLIEDTSRETASEFMKLNGYLDLLIPRGGAGLIRAVVKNATVPVIETGAGVCHVYVDKNSDIQMAADIIYNAKTQRPSVCNACETILVHKDIAADALPVIKLRLDEKRVELRCDETALSVLPGTVLATDEDWHKEYGDYILAVKVVESLSEAADHIAKYGTGHSEAIVTTDYFAAEEFLRLVNSAAVYVNASTRFTDGEEFGLGAEIGISTGKLHARGPMGLQDMTTVKYVIYGDGQIR